PYTPLFRSETEPHPTGTAKFSVCGLRLPVRTRSRTAPNTAPSVPPVQRTGCGPSEPHPVFVPASTRLPLDGHLVEQMARTRELVDNEKYVTDIHVDAPLKLRLEEHVAAHV